jgi:hypothetical protein
MWARLTAGVIPGFVLTAASINLVCWLLPGRWEATLVPALLVFFPLWIGVICSALRFSSGIRAWCWLSTLAAALLAASWMLPASGWVS